MYTKEGLNIVSKSFLPAETKKLIIEKWGNLDEFNKLVIVTVLECNLNVKKKYEEAIEIVKNFVRDYKKKTRKMAENKERSINNVEKILKKLDHLDFWKMPEQGLIFRKENRLVFFANDQVPTGGEFLNKFNQKLETGSEEKWKIENWKKALENTLEDAVSQCEATPFSEIKDNKNIKDLNEKRLKELDDKLKMLNIPEVMTEEAVELLVRQIVEFPNLINSKIKLGETEAKTVLEEIKGKVNTEFRSFYYDSRLLLRLTNSPSIEKEILDLLKKNGLDKTYEEMAGFLFKHADGVLMDDMGQLNSTCKRIYNKFSDYPGLKDLILELSAKTGYLVDMREYMYTSHWPILVEILKLDSGKKKELLQSIIRYCQETGKPFVDILPVGIDNLFKLGTLGSTVRKIDNQQNTFKSNLGDNTLNYNNFSQFELINKAGVEDTMVALSNAGVFRDRSYLEDINSNYVDGIKEISQARAESTVKKINKEFGYIFKPEDAYWLVQVHQNEPDKVIATAKELGITISTGAAMKAVVDIVKTNSLPTVKELLKDTIYEATEGNSKPTVDKFNRLADILLVVKEKATETLRLLEREGIPFNLGEENYADNLLNINKWTEERKQKIPVAIEQYKKFFKNAEKVKIDQVKKIVSYYENDVMELAAECEKYMDSPTIEEILQVRDSKMLPTLRYIYEQYNLRSKLDETLIAFHTSGAIYSLKLLKEQFGRDGVSFLYETFDIDKYASIHALDREEKIRLIKTTKKLVEEAGYTFKPRDYQKILCLGEARADDTAVEIHDVLNYVLDLSDLENMIEIKKMEPKKRQELIQIAFNLQNKAGYEFRAEDWEKLFEVKRLELTETVEILYKEFDQKFKAKDFDKVAEIKEKGMIETARLVFKELGSAMSTAERESFTGRLFDNWYGYSNFKMIHENKLGKMFGKMMNMARGDLSILDEIDYARLNEATYRDWLTILMKKAEKGTRQYVLKDEFKVLKYAGKMDFSYAAGKKALDGINSFKHERNVKTEEDLFEIFGTDYRKTESTWHRIDTRQVLGNWADLEKGISLQKFDPENVEVYELFFNFLRESGLTHWEDRALKAIDYSPFEKYVKENNLGVVMNKIKECQNRIHPQINEFFLKYLIPSSQGFAGKLKKYKQGKKEMLNVTQNNLDEIQGYLELALMFKDSNDFDLRQVLQEIFPDHQTSGEFEKDFAFLMNALDVEEVNFQEINSLPQMKGLLRLQKLARDFENKANATYIHNKFKEIDVLKMFAKGKINEAETESTFCCDAQTVEEIRKYLNDNVDRLTGDKLVFAIAEDFLKKNPPSYQNLSLLLRFAKSWQEIDVDRDVKGLYRICSKFTYNKIVKFLYAQLGVGQVNKKKVEEDLKKVGYSFDGITNELKLRGIPFEVKLDDWQKGITRITNGGFGYVTSKVSQKIFGGEGKIEGMENANLEKMDWKTKDGVSVYRVMVNGIEKAKMIKCQRGKTGVKHLINEEGIVDMKKEEKENGDKLIFSAPLAFTTGNHKMTEIAIAEGEIMNYLLSSEGKDGLVITDKKGNVKILNKTKLKISDFADFVSIDGKIETENKIQDRPLDFMNDIEDFVWVLETMRSKKLSLLANMLLVEEGNVADFKDDGADSRRFFVEFSDGDIGIMDSTKNMSTKSLMELSAKVSVKNAVYMDTGMYDMATYYEQGGENRVLGHQDTSGSTNRLVIYEMEANNQ